MDRKIAIIATRLVDCLDQLDRRADRIRPFPALQRDAEAERTAYRLALAIVAGVEGYRDVDPFVLAVRQLDAATDRHLDLGYLPGELRPLDEPR